MRIALGADEHTPLTDLLARELWERGHQVTLARLYPLPAGSLPAGHASRWAAAVSRWSFRRIRLCWRHAKKAIAENLDADRAYMAAAGNLGNG